MRAVRVAVIYEESLYRKTPLAGSSNSRTNVERTGASSADGPTISIINAQILRYGGHRLLMSELINY